MQLNGTCGGIELQGRRSILARAFLEDGAPAAAGVDRFLDANVLVRSSEGETKVIVATVWDSIESINAFAGENYEKAVVEPIVSYPLERFDDDVTHYAVAVAAEDT